MDHSRGISFPRKVKAKLLGYIWFEGKGKEENSGIERKEKERSGEE